MVSDTLWADMFWHPWWRPLPLFILTGGALVVAGPRAWALVSLVRHGRPNPERRKWVMRPQYAFLKIIGQKKLLQWSGPGVLHAFTFWGFLVIQVALLESLGEFFWKRFRLPIIGTHTWFGATLDFFIAAVGGSLEEIVNTFVFPDMITKFCRGQSMEDAVKWGVGEYRRIYAKHKA